MPSLGTRVEDALAPRFTGVVEVGAGGMGTVFRARDTELGRDVAIKVLAPELATAAGVARFRHEARILARLAHPHIVPVFDEGECDGLFFYLMEYLPGETLRDRLDRGRLAPAEAIRLGEQLLRALERVHAEGIVHRDLKPSNIRLMDGRAVLVDFGVARWDAGDRSALTHPGDRPGTPAYMAPEQLAGGAVTPQTDLYALGRVLYEALTGRQWNFLARPERADWTGVPRRIVPVLRRALALTPAARWEGAAQFRRALRRAGRPLLPGVPAVAVLVAGASVVVVLASAAARVMGRAPTARAAAAADLMLLPFDEGDSARLGRRLARLAGMQLEWYPRWSMTPTLQSFERWDAAGRQGVVPAWFGGAAHEARGAVVRRPDGWDLVISVHGDSGRRLYETIVIPGDPSQPLAWARRAADSLVARVFPGAAAEFAELTSRATGSTRAVTAYLAGSDAFARDDLAEAERRYAEALELDAGFTQAAWQLTLVRRWRRQEVGPELERLYRERGAELPALYRALTAGQLEPDLRARSAKLAAAADSFRSRGVAGVIAADEMFHRGALVGIPLERALEAFARAAERDPLADQAAVHDELAWGYINLGRRAAAQERIRRRAERPDAGGESATHAAFLSLAYDARFVPWRAAAKTTWLGWTADSGTRAAIAKYLRVGTFVGVPTLQEQLAAVLLTGGEAPADHVQAHVARALALLMRGQWNVGLAALDSAALVAPSAELRLQQAEWRIVPGLLGMPPRPAAESGRAAAVLRGVATAGGPLAARAAWALALDALQRRDTAGYAVHHARVHADPTGTGERLDLLLHAYAAAARGRPDSALRLTEPLFLTDSAGRVGGPFARAALYLGRGEWHLRTGDSTAAARSFLWYENSDFDGWPAGAPQAAEADQVFGPYGRIRRAAAVQASDDTEACELRARAAELWDDADPELLRLVRDVPSPCRR